MRVMDKGYYVNLNNEEVDISGLMRAAMNAKVSIPPDSTLPEAPGHFFKEIRVQVANETTLRAALRLSDAGPRPLTLNFANGIHSGGGFLHGARAQEEVLCRPSAFYATLVGDPMYDAHRKRPEADSTDWVILHPWE